MPKRSVLIAADGKQREAYERLSLPGERVEYCSLPETEARLGCTEADLVILDCGADGEAGLCTLKRVKESHEGVPVVFVTCASSEDLVLQAYKVGVRDYFRHPVEPHDFCATVCRLLSLKRGGAPLLPVTCGVLPPAILRAVSYMENHLSDPVQLETLAREACVSKYHFCRTFKRHVGMSPMHCLAFMRIQRAQQLLCDKGVSISVVAYRSGFNDLSEFNKQFKKLTGLTPSAYRKSNHSR
jgi:AraC-like DNA-binding protein